MNSLVSAQLVPRMGFTELGSDGVTFEVNIKNTSSDIVKGIKDFSVETEQYYMHTIISEDIQ